MKKTGLTILLLVGGCFVAMAQNQTTDDSDKNFGQQLVESIKMVYVEGGEFMMGATSEQGGYVKEEEKPAHKVKLSSFYISKYEITQAQYQAIMGTQYNGFEGERRPVENVSWNDAMKFCEKLSARSGRNYTLPTEAQWEYAARGGNKSKGYKYSGGNDPDEVAGYYDNNASLGSEHPDYGTHEVGMKVPNELGIYDMSGNVMEWCADGPRKYSSKDETNPRGSTDGTYRVVRGGGWDSSARNDCRVSSRGETEYYNSNNKLGFRVVCLP